MTHKNKFGMFIHWGIYALTELQDQAFTRYGLDREEYEGLAKKFNPEKYNPEEWVLLAKEAGMEYICFTTKHHDGFCMWDTKYTDYNIMNTPYGKDVLKMLAEACEKHGMRLSLYYSNPDYHHPCAYNPLSILQAGSVNKDLEHFYENFAQYKIFIKDQITELLTNYGKIYTLFWDIPPKMRDDSMNAYVRSLQPDILINNRGFDPGDFATPEREYGKDGSKEPFAKMTEKCNAIDTQSWGYRRDSDFYSYRYLLSDIDKIMVRGGSYLLNIGPRADGTLDPVHVARIKRIGDWYNRMEGCLKEHEPDPVTYSIRQDKPWDEWIAVCKNGKTYLHCYNGINATAITMGKFPGMPKAVRLMNTGEQLPFRVQRLPNYFIGDTCRAEQAYLRIYNIPVDELEQEPIVLEIQWND